MLTTFDFTPDLCGGECIEKERRSLWACSLINRLIAGAIVVRNFEPPNTP